VSNEPDLASRAGAPVQSSVDGHPCPEPLTPLNGQDRPLAPLTLSDRHRRKVGVVLDQDRTGEFQWQSASHVDASPAGEARRIADAA
jgi:hypothetical protein